MGYRLGVTQIGGKLDFYGNKLYGYYGYPENLKSINFLISKKYLIEGVNIFTDGENGKIIYGFWDGDEPGNIVMKVRDFKVFIKLYSEDTNKCMELKETDKDYNWILKHKTIKKLCQLHDCDDIVLHWS